MSSSLLCVFERIKYGLSVKSTQENHAERKLLMENLSEHLKENVTYINGLFENAMDYIEREFMVGTYRPRCSPWTGSSASSTLL